MKRPFIESFRYYSLKELARILSILRLSPKLFNDTINAVIQFYRQFSPYTDNHDPLVLTPVALYIITKSRFIFINKEKLKENLLCDYNKFRTCLNAVLINNPKIQKWFCSPGFRKKLIRNVLFGISNHFKYGSNFLAHAYILLNKHFERFSNRKDTILVMYIWYLTIRQLQGELNYGQEKGVCQFLGIQQSNLSNQKMILDNLTINRKI